MRWCCPPRHGCNASDRREPCALAVCESFADEEPDAALALARWAALTDALGRGRHRGELRFRRRSYERARDRALVAVALRAAARLRPTGMGTRKSVRSRSRRDGSRRLAQLRSRRS